MLIEVPLADGPCRPNQPGYVVAEPAGKQDRDQHAQPEHTERDYRHRDQGLGAAGREIVLGCSDGLILEVPKLRAGDLDVVDQG